MRILIWPAMRYSGEMVSGRSRRLSASRGRDTCHRSRAARGGNGELTVYDIAEENTVFLDEGTAAVALTRLWASMKDILIERFFSRWIRYRSNAIGRQLPEICLDQDLPAALIFEQLFAAPQHSSRTRVTDSPRGRPQHSFTIHSKLDDCIPSQYNVSSKYFNCAQSTIQP
jgi:hypothetical protein